MAKKDVDSNNDVLLADINRYLELFYKLSKSSVEQTELSELQSTLADYLLIASDYNDLVTAINTNIGDISDNASDISTNTSDISNLETDKKDSADFISGAGATLSNTGWTASIDGRFTYYKDVTITGMTSDYLPIVTYSESTIGYAEDVSLFTDSRSGAIRFKATAIPDASISFDWKGVKF